MACVNPDGSLTPVAGEVLGAIASLGAGATVAAVARAAGLPLYRARVSLRELAAAGLVVGEEGAVRLSDAGLARLAAIPALPAARG